MTYRASSWTSALLLATSAVLGPGCVSQESHDQLRRINRTIEEQKLALEQDISQLQQVLAEKDAAIRQMKDQSQVNAAMQARLAEEQQTVAALRNHIAGLQAELAKLASEITQGAEQIVVVNNGLPPEISNALADLALANADLMTYDQARGMIRLRSDLTFALGSATVSKQAKTALTRLARVLNTNEANKFDIQVIGHTDASPVRSAKGKQLHVDNRGLSSNRGDAVARILITNGVPAKRIVSGGRGATQPIAPNDAKGRSKANRRVEIFLVKSADAAPAQTGAATEPLPTRITETIPHGAPKAPHSGVTKGKPKAPGDHIYK